MSTTNPSVRGVWILPILGIALASCRPARPRSPSDPKPAAPDSSQVRELSRDLHRYFDALVAQDRDSIRALTTPDFVLLENGYPMGLQRLTETWDRAQPLKTRYELHDLRVGIVDTVALFQYGLGWYAGDRRLIWGMETGIARRSEGGWRFAQFHSSWFPARTAAAPAGLSTYVGRYLGRFRGHPTTLVVSVVDGQLRVDTASQRAWMAGVRSVRLFPAGRDRFSLEFADTPARFLRNAAGQISGLDLSVDDTETIHLDRSR